jgi:hypothetical protein
MRQFDGIVAEDDDGTRHLADLIAAFGPFDIAVGIVGGERAHTRGKIQQRTGDAAGYIVDNGNQAQRGQQDRKKDQVAGRLVRDEGALACPAGMFDGAVGQKTQRLIGNAVCRQRGMQIDGDGLGIAMMARRASTLMAISS